MFEYRIINVIDGVAIWSVVFRNGDPLPRPMEVGSSGYSLRRPFLQPGLIRLGANDAVIEGVARYQYPGHRLRAWIMMWKPEIENVSRTIALGRDKKLIRTAIGEGRCRMPPEYLNGKGGLAALIRILHALRGGMSISEFDNNC